MYAYTMYMYLSEPAISDRCCLEYKQQPPKAACDRHTTQTHKYNFILTSLLHNTLYYTY